MLKPIRSDYCPDGEYIRVRFTLEPSKAALLSNIDALQKARNKPGPFDYIIRLKKSLQDERSIAHHLPHLFDPKLVVNPHQVTAAARAYRSFSDEQKAAFERMRTAPHGMYFVNGHAGTGKAHLATHIAAMSQTQTKSDANVKVLYLLETSKAVDDTAIKLFKVYNKLKVYKQIVRIPSLPFRFRTVVVDGATSETQQLAPILNFTMGFLRRLLHHEKGLPFQYEVNEEGKVWIPELVLPKPRRAYTYNLDEAAYIWFLKNRASFHGLHLAATEVRKRVETEDNQRHLPDLHALLEPLYCHVLGAADVVITTPAAATQKLLTTVFNPTVVIYDQAAKARELSTLVPVGYYNPLLTIFIGDIKQLLPSPSKATRLEKEHFEALETSTLARVVHKGGNASHLNVNHRAYGRLHELPSKLFYSGALRSSIPVSAQFKSPVDDFQRYLNKLRGHDSTIPRLLVSLFNSTWEPTKGTSSWNPVHHAWILSKVQSVLSESWFSGTILIITSSKGASAKYDDAVDGWPQWERCRVTIRTVNTVIGSEADLVFVDIVKPSKYIDDRHKLCTALSKAKYGEIILMSYKMTTMRLGSTQHGKETPETSSKYLSKVMEECEENRQVLRDTWFGRDIKERVESDKVERRKREQEEYD